MVLKNLYDILKVHQVSVLVLGIIRYSSNKFFFFEAPVHSKGDLHKRDVLKINASPMWSLIWKCFSICDIQRHHRSLNCLITSSLSWVVHPCV